MMEHRLALGIDTGGTFTDAALLDTHTGQVVAAAKALTTYGNLATGILESTQALNGLDPARIDLVSISTTLATNATVEGYGRPCALILVGYDRELLQDRGFMSELGTERIVFCAGGHDANGNEQAPLDVAALKRAAQAHQADVAAFAVSSYFSVRNPSHEILAQQLLQEWTGLPVTCGHALSSKLNSVRRATTAALNARLIPLITELVEAVQHALDAWGIQSPLMVVKGDGSLVSADVALHRPVETILSGPAASAVGGRFLSKSDNIVVVDMGGTTTDIAVLTDGQPRLNPQGAQVGRWQTMVEAVDMRTVGLGGDSRVRRNREGQLQIGPQRVIALCRLAAQDERILPMLEAQAVSKKLHQEAGVFVQATGVATELPEPFQDIVHGPVALAQILTDSGYPFLVRDQLDRLIGQGLVKIAAFTPTDALHVLGTYRAWSDAAALLGARILGRWMGQDPLALCQRIVRQVAEAAAKEVVAKAVSDRLGEVPWPGDAIASYLVNQGLDHHHASDPLLHYELRLKQPLVAIGAPVRAYFPQVAEHLHSQLVIPPHAEVANAVGAVAGGILQRARMEIRPLDNGLYRLHHLEGINDFETPEEAVAFAEPRGRAFVEQQARQAGATHIELHVEQEDHIVTPADRIEEIYLGADLHFTAVGRVIPIG